MFISRDVINAIRPQLISLPAAINQWTVSLVDYAEAMVAITMARCKITHNTVADDTQHS
jgi:TetR/AcrR family transcriptional regulator, regulator of cefoperazone and chloramphenicol sensitivity